MDKKLQREYISAQLAGYLSGYVEFKDRHPYDLLPLADHCIAGLEKITGIKLIPENERED